MRSRLLPGPPGLVLAEGGGRGPQSPPQSCRPGMEGGSGTSAGSANVSLQGEEEMFQSLWSLRSASKLQYSSTGQEQPPLDL